MKKNINPYQKNDALLQNTDTNALKQHIQILTLPDNKDTSNNLTDSVSFDSLKAHLNNQIDVKAVDPIQRAKLNPKSLRLALNAQCYDCIYDKSETGTWRQQVEACLSKNCPLYCHRPQTTSKGEAA